MWVVLHLNRPLWWTVNDSRLLSRMALLDTDGWREGFNWTRDSKRLGYRLAQISWHLVR